MTLSRVFSYVVYMSLIVVVSGTIFAQVSVDTISAPDLHRELESLQAAHGGGINTICGFGTVTNLVSNGDKTYPFQVCATAHSMRAETTLPSGITTQIVDQNIGIVRFPGGKHFKISGRNAILWRPTYFPPLLVMTLLGDQEYNSATSINKAQASDGISLHRQHRLNLSASMRLDADDVSVERDISTGLISSFSWNQSLDARGLQYLTIPDSVQYADYVQSGGHWLAGTVTSIHAGVKRSVIHFSHFEINPTLPSDEFAVSKEEMQ